MFNEKEHPRDDSGKFAEKSASDLKSELMQELPEQDASQFGSQEELNNLLGEEFKGYKGQDAIDKLLKEKRGHVKGAFHREDIGDIDLLWGNDYMGLQHIIKQREKQGINANEFVSQLTDIVNKGKYHKRNDRGNFEFLHKGKMVIIAPEYHGNRITYILTAYKTNIKNKTS